MTPTKLSERVLESFPVTSHVTDVDMINLVDPDARPVRERPLSFDEHFEHAARVHDDVLSLEIDDDIGLEGVMAFQDFLTAFSDVRHSVNVAKVAELATLQPDVSEHHGLTDGLILEFLDAIPSHVKEIHKLDDEMSAVSYLFKTTRHSTEKFKVNRTEHSFTGTRTVYYSLTSNRREADL